MGFREELTSNWKGKVIDYQDKKFYILTQFEFEGKEYLYGIDIDTIKNEIINVVFLYKVKDDIFEHVESKELFDILVVRVAGLITADIIKKELSDFNPESDN